MNNLRPDGPEQPRAVVGRIDRQLTITARSAKHWHGVLGHCSLCNRDEMGRRGARVGVVVRARDLDTGELHRARHWFCPECARAIAKVTP